MHTYLDLLNPDGTRNMIALAAILAHRVEAAVNAQLCGVARIPCPRHVQLGDVAAWHAEQVKARGLGPLTAAERDRIADGELSRLDDWARAMQGAAKSQRLVWLAASERTEVGAFAAAAE